MTTQINAADSMEAVRTLNNFSEMVETTKAKNTLRKLIDCYLLTNEDIPSDRQAIYDVFFCFEELLNNIEKISK